MSYPRWRFVIHYKDGTEEEWWSTELTEDLALIQLLETWRSDNIIRPMKSIDFGGFDEHGLLTYPTESETTNAAF